MKATTGSIWEAASKEKTRPILTGVMFDAKKATLTASDSYIAARVPCEVEDGDESGLIPAVAIKEANGRSLRVADGKATLILPDGDRSWTLIPGEPPDIDKILADYPEIEGPFGMNPDLLKSLATALGCGGKGFVPIRLHPLSPVRGIRATGPGSTAGVIMPVRLPSNGNGATAVKAPADLGNDDAVIAAARAAVVALDRRRGKKRAAQAFRDALQRAEAV